jgi:uncharacterized protein (DUF58 family)
VYLIVAALLSFMGISGFFGKSNLSGIAVAVEFPPEIYANAAFPLKVTLRNKRRILPVFLMKVRLGELTLLFPFVDQKSESTQYVTTVFSKRGRQKIENIYVSSVFPFNFFTRYKIVQSIFSFIVFPELRKCDLLGMYEQEKRLKGEDITDKIGYESDMISIREYMHGDPLKYINWKATAKTGRLKTKELSSPAHQPIVIDFDRVAIKETEEKLSCIAYSLLQFIKMNTPVGLKMNGRLYEPGFSHPHKIGMLKELALYKGRAEP